MSRRWTAQRVGKVYDRSCDGAAQVTTRFGCDEAEKTIYDHHYPLYGELYRALKDSFRRIAEVVG